MSTAQYFSCCTNKCIPCCDDANEARYIDTGDRRGQFDAYNNFDRKCPVTIEFRNIHSGTTHHIHTYSLDGSGTEEIEDIAVGETYRFSYYLDWPVYQDYFSANGEHVDEILTYVDCILPQQYDWFSQSDNGFSAL